MINKFLSSFTDDLARPSRFKVMISIPPVLQDQGIIGMDTLTLRCENASLPGRNLATGDLRIYGPTEKYPYQSTYDDISLTFIVSGSMIEKTLFDRWMEYINPTNTWNFQYKKDYVQPIEIIQYDTSNNEVQKVKLIDAFPVSINQMDLDWSNENTYHKLTVSFAYTYWRVVATAESSQHVSASKNSPFPSAALIQAGALANSLGKTLDGNNPYAVLGAIGAATSIIPSMGDTRTLSSIINSQGRGNLDTQLDIDSSTVNKMNNTISGLRDKASNPFSF